MKLVTYRLRDDQSDRVGSLLSSLDAVVDLTDHFRDMLELIDAGDPGLAQARQLTEERAGRPIPLTDIGLRSPLMPRQLRDVMAFEQHYQQSIDQIARLRLGPFAGLAPLVRALGIAKIPRVWYEQPIYYKCNRFSVVGTDCDVRWPRGANLLDYECELAAVIGKTGKDIPRERALEHIFGFTIYNDMTARDLQLREMAARLGPAKGKDFDTGNVLGPWLVTRDELDPYALTMISRVNGEERGRGYSRDMHHRWEDIVAHLSQNETLHAGEVIGSGTVGNGCGLEQGRFLAAEDVVELEITGLGCLRNRLIR